MPLTYVLDSVGRNLAAYKWLLVQVPRPDLFCRSPRSKGMASDGQTPRSNIEKINSHYTSWWDLQFCFSDNQVSLSSC